MLGIRAHPSLHQTTSLTVTSNHALPSEERQTLVDEKTTANEGAFTTNTLTTAESEVMNTPVDDATNTTLPVKDTVSITPAQDFSHPTPPPEPASVETAENLPPATEQAAVTDSAPSAETIVASEAQPTSLTSQSAPESEVTRPIETQQEPAVTVSEETMKVPLQSNAESGQNLLNGMPSSSIPPTSTELSVDAPAPVKVETATSSLVRPRDEDMDEEPAAKRSKVDEVDAKEDSQNQPSSATTAPVDAEGDVSMADASFTESAAPASQGASKYPTNPMTPLQKSYLLEKTKNTRKTKHAQPFLAPVDPVKLGIPNYPNIIKNPMDLGTLETKLKNDQYASPQAYADDFNLIVSNSREFNGPTHVVTVAANNMEAYFKKYMSVMPGPDQTAPTKAAKKQESAVPRPQPRREARVVQQPPTASPAPAASPNAANNQIFALQADGTPQIRRDSTIKRPHRTIKPPQNRELSYAKPKRKEHQLELKFCEHVLDEMRGPAYSHVNHVFLVPVDPIALNIPHYRQIIKKPMDMQTMSRNLTLGEYGTAKEFKADFEQMIENCMIFNPPGNAVRELGTEMKKGFESLWKEKDKWERANKKTSERASSDSAESEEESEEDEDEDDPALAARETIAALTKQLADLQKTVAAANWSKDGAKKKSKDGKKSKKNSLSAPSKPKASSKSKAPKKVKALSYDDKQEISNAVPRMNEQQVSKLTQIIVDNCEKYRNMGDEMELEIDDLPNDIQAMLLKYVRSLFGNPNRGARVASPEDLAAEDDDDFAPPARDRPTGAGKRKKHKPMGKKEQQDSIAELRNRLAAFDDPAEGAGGMQYGQAADETSGDEESEESEEE